MIPHIKTAQEANKRDGGSGLCDQGPGVLCPAVV